MAKPKHAWMVRAGNENELADIVQEENVVAIGWDNMEDVSSLGTREHFKQRYRDANPEDSPSRVAVNAGQVYRFAQEIRQGDTPFLRLKLLIPVGLPVLARQPLLQHGLLAGD